jgi:NTP pyrophosphatase (non-canonical NTP hydrolase)
VEAGWWHNEEGVHLTTVPYYNELKIAQIHGEVSEMLEGIRKGEMDKHCPEFTNEEVEAADVLIRHLDYCGARKLRLAEAVVAKMRYNVTRADHTKEARNAPGGKRY